ncbi:hypothetical protein BDZ94DRAFT_1324481 [Collybia nuda]|uniref:F-box domain-containing protein n=1 Tax=Collybia nuda TaxID=64659 RepID=A0A9P6CGC8_9AGAR|nr:hypothetical protein BDZ94DRAFT_1324481 [Collybia nuda]
MPDPIDDTAVSSQLIELRECFISWFMFSTLKETREYIPVLPEALFSIALARYVGPPLNKEQIIRNEEFRQLEKATEMLRRSNAVPQSTDIDLIESFKKKCASDISQDMDYIGSLQFKINGLLNKLNTTRIRQQYVQELSDHFKPLCSPVRRLPPEILTIIFQFCLPENANACSGAPLTLCHVCSLWRNVALGSQGLWNNFSLNLGTTSTSRYEEISKFYFRNSRNSPRTLKYYREPNGISPPGPQQAFHDLATSSRLIRKLTCINFVPRYFTPFLQLPSTEAPLLEAVRLISAGVFNGPITVLQTAPRLRVIYLDLSLSFFDGILPWSQLTWIKIQDPMHMTHWAAAFQQCWQLEHGYFEVVVSLSGDFGLRDFAVTLENLQTLDLAIFGADRNLFQYLFKKMKFPNLRHLRLTDIFSDGYLGLPFIDAVSFSSLRSLSLQSITIGEDTCTSLFSATPALERLALDITPMNYYPTVAPLIRGTRSLLPNLSHLYLCMLYDDVESWPDLIFSAITSRFHGCFTPLVPLRCVSLFFWRSEDEDEDEDKFGDDNSVTTTTDGAERISSMIKDHPFSEGVDIRTSIVRQCPNLCEVIEEGWHEW